MILLKQVFKTLHGAQKRAAFETTHCNKKFYYHPVRCIDGKVDRNDYDKSRFAQYTWQILRLARNSKAPYSPLIERKE